MREFVCELRVCIVDATGVLLSELLKGFFKSSFKARPSKSSSRASFEARHLRASLRASFKARPLRASLRAS